MPNSARLGTRKNDVTVRKPLLRALAAFAARVKELKPGPAKDGVFILVLELLRDATRAIPECRLV
jgi:hypothetical protein